MSRNKLYINVFLLALLPAVTILAFSPIGPVEFAQQQEQAERRIYLDSLRRANDRLVMKIQEKTKNYELKDRSK